MQRLPVDVIARIIGFTTVPTVLDLRLAVGDAIDKAVSTRVLEDVLEAWFACMQATSASPCACMPPVPHGFEPGGEAAASPLAGRHFANPSPGFFDQRLLAKLFLVCGAHHRPAVHLVHWLHTMLNFSADVDTDAMPLPAYVIRVSRHPLAFVVHQMLSTVHASHGASSRCMVKSAHGRDAATLWAAPAPAVKAAPRSSKQKSASTAAANRKDATMHETAIEFFCTDTIVFFTTPTLKDAAPFVLKCASSVTRPVPRTVLIAAAPGDLHPAPPSMTPVSLSRATVDQQTAVGRSLLVCAKAVGKYLPGKQACRSLTRVSFLPGSELPDWGGLAARGLTDLEFWNDARLSHHDDGEQRASLFELSSVSVNEKRCADSLTPNPTGHHPRPKAFGRSPLDVAGCFGWSCAKLRTLDLRSESGRLRSLPPFFAADCPSLVSVTLPHTIEVLHAACFSELRRLAWLTLPRSLRRVGSKFLQSANLAVVPNLGAACPHLDELGPRAFEAAVVPSGFIETLPKSIQSVDAHWFRNSIIRSPTVTLALPKLTAIAEESFFQLVGTVVSIDLSGCTSLDSIANGCFSRCGSLRSIAFPASVTALGDSVCVACPDLIEVTFGSAKRAHPVFKKDHHVYIGGKFAQNSTQLICFRWSSMAAVGDHATLTLSVGVNFLPHVQLAHLQCLLDTENIVIAPRSGPGAVPAEGSAPQKSALPVRFADME